MTEAIITLRPLVENDAPQIAHLANNKNIWTHVRDLMPFPYTIEDAHSFIRHVNNQHKNHVFGIIYVDTLVGICSIHPFEDVYRFTAEIGYWIGEPYWGQGIATGAIRELVSYARTNLSLKRIQAGVFSYNLASMKVLEKNGFEKEAIHRSHVFKNGAFHDEHIYSLVNDSP